ncbi:MAG: endonuclease domain-containing protein [Parvularculaceae bacterium]
MADERARKLRREATPDERLLWRYLRKTEHSLHFRRQAPIGPYYADFVCLQARLVIELDGGGHDRDAQASHDARRDVWFARAGFEVLRFRNSELRREPDRIANFIIAAAIERREAIRWTRLED